MRRQRVLYYLGERPRAIKEGLGGAQKAVMTGKPPAKQAVDEASGAAEEGRSAG